MKNGYIEPLINQLELRYAGMKVTSTSDDIFRSNGNVIEYNKNSEKWIQIVNHK